MTQTIYMYWYVKGEESCLSQNDDKQLTYMYIMCKSNWCTPLLFSWAGAQDETVSTLVFSIVCKATIKWTWLCVYLCDIFVYVLQVILSAERIKVSSNSWKFCVCVFWSSWHSIYAQWFLVIVKSWSYWQNISGLLKLTLYYTVALNEGDTQLTI